MGKWHANKLGEPIDIKKNLVPKASNKFGWKSNKKKVS